MSDRLEAKQANHIVAFDKVDGQLILKRYDGSELKYGGSVVSDVVLTSLDPASMPHEPGSMAVVQLFGTGFKPDLRVYLDNGTANGMQPATYISDTEATVPELATNSVGPWSLTVRNPPWLPSSASNALTFTVT